MRSLLVQHFVQIIIIAPFRREKLLNDAIFVCQIDSLTPVFIIFVIIKQLTTSGVTFRMTDYISPEARDLLLLLGYLIFALFLTKTPVPH